MPATNQKKYSNVQYWRFVFTPLLLGSIILGLFLLFSSSDTQTTDFGSVIKRTNSLLADPGRTVIANAVNTVLKTVNSS
jgi:hypothetical protein